MQGRAVDIRHDRLGEALREGGGGSGDLHAVEGEIHRAGVVLVVLGGEEDAIDPRRSIAEGNAGRAGVNRGPVGDGEGIRLGLRVDVDAHVIDRARCIGDAGVDEGRSAIVPPPRRTAGGADGEAPGGVGVELRSGGRRAAKDGVVAARVRRHGGNRRVGAEVEAQRPRGCRVDHGGVKRAGDGSTVVRGSAGVAHLHGEVIAAGIQRCRGGGGIRQRDIGGGGFVGDPSREPAGADRAGIAIHERTGVAIGEICHDLGRGWRAQGRQDGGAGNCDMPDADAQA